MTADFTPRAWLLMRRLAAADTPVAALAGLWFNAAGTVFFGFLVDARTITD